MTSERTGKPAVFEPASLSACIVLSGGFGSGKSEIAINLTRAWAAAGDVTTLVDLDLVKPLFRSREARLTHSLDGVRVVCSAPGLEGADLPSLPPELLGALEDSLPSHRVCVDLGGDDSGAGAIGRYRHVVAQREHEVLLVCNPFRPFTGGPNEVERLRRAIEARSGLRVTGLVSNPNVGGETTGEYVRRGHDIVCRISEGFGLPIRFVCVARVTTQGDGPQLSRADAETDELADGTWPVFVLRRHLLPPWESDDPQLWEE